MLSFAGAKDHGLNNGYSQPYIKSLHWLKRKQVKEKDLEV